MKLTLVLPLAAALTGCCAASAPQTPAKVPANATASATTPVWQVIPGQPTYYINSVAVSGDGNRVVGGTFFHSYGSGAGTHTAAPQDDGGKQRAERETSAAPSAVASSSAAKPKSTADGQTGTFGTYCYDGAGHLLWKNEFQGWQGVYWVDVSTNGAYAASGGWFSQTPYYAGFVRAFDARTGATLLDARTAQRVNQVALSADGTWLLSAAENLNLFQLSNRMYQQTDHFAAPAVSTGSNYFISAGLSADGGTVVASDYAGHILLLSVSDGKFSLLKQWSLPSAYSHMVRITPDGKTFVCGGPAGSFYLFDTAQFISTGQPTTSYNTGQGGSVYSVAVSDDGSAFVGVANYQSTLGMVYYVTRNASGCALSWKYQTAHNPNCAWINSGKGLLAIADGHPDGTPGAFYLFNTADGSLRWQYPTGNMSWPIMISADGSAVAAGSDDAAMYYFRP